MNTYRLVLGCVVIICYLQQHGWAAPSPIENAQPSIQQTHLDNQFGEGILEDAVKKALVDLPKTQSHIQKRWLNFAGIFERIRQNLRDSLYERFYCNIKYLRFDLHYNYTNDSYDDPTCYIPHVIPLTGDLLQTYNNMDHPLCADLAFFKAFRLKILSKSFANDTDTKRFLCYTNRGIDALESIQNLRPQTCPDFTDSQLLAIYDSYDDSFHTPESKYCILLSYFWNSWDHGVGDIPNEGYDVTLQGMRCDHRYPYCY